MACRGTCIATCPLEFGFAARVDRAPPHCLSMLVSPQSTEGVLACIDLLFHPIHLFVGCCFDDTFHKPLKYEYLPMTNRLKSRTMVAVSQLEPCKRTRKTLSLIANGDQSSTRQSTARATPLLENATLPDVALTKATPNSTLASPQTLNLSRHATFASSNEFFVSSHDSDTRKAVHSKPVSTEEACCHMGLRCATCFARLCQKCDNTG